MDKIQKLAKQLQEKEIKVLKALVKYKSLSVDAVSKATKLKPVEVGRASMYLENKQLVSRTKSKSKVVELDTEGKKYSKSGLPEFKFLELIEKPASIDQLKKHLSSDEIKFSIGYWKKKGMIIFDKGLIKPVPVKKPKASSENELIKKLPMVYDSLSPKEKEAVKKLGLRKAIITIVEKAEVTLKITKLGQDISKVKVSSGVGKLTKSIISAGMYKSFRRYDVEAPVPKIAMGRPHPYLSFLDEVKSELTNMGFTEMNGPLVESSFFCLDALFMPQDHPARGIHDVYFVKGEASVKSDLLTSVKLAHENGGDTGSTGWGIPFSIKKAKELVLPSQGTHLSARTLAEHSEKEGKYFAIARTYRPDVVDKTHLSEFNQVEGIIISKDANFAQLLSLLREFAKKMTGVKDKDIMFVPGYFPFTEPSVECFIRHPKKGWIELLGAGMFRPEVTVPLGITYPVLAWGIGVDRLFMIKENISDIRYLFGSDLKWLKEAKI